MGILDEAIREHLELKRQHGAAEPELKKLEDEALGAPGAAGGIEEPPEMSDADAEAPTDYIGSPAAAPPEQDEAGTEVAAQSDAGTLEEEAPAPAPDLRPPEMRPEEPPPSPAEAGEAEPARDAAEAPASEGPPAEEEHPAMELEVPAPAPADADPETSAEPPEPPPVEAGGVSSELRAEREEIAQHPTEHYDVEGEIAEAEKEAAGFFNEQSLSDELDRALDSPEESAPSTEEPVPADATDEEPVPADATDEVEVVEEPAQAEEPGEVDVVEPADDERTEPEEVAEIDAEVVEEADVVEEQEAADNIDEEESPAPIEEQESGEDAAEEDVLEETPDFLQDSPEHDRLWFEQKPPKDFDFDD